MNDRTHSLIDQLVEQERRKPPKDDTPDTVVTSATDQDELDEEVSSTRGFASVRGQRDRAETIEFRMLNPAEPDTACEYSFRRRTIWHKAEGVIELVFVDGLHVKIKGINLEELKEKIRLRRVTWVAEQGSDKVEMQAAKQTARENHEPFVWVERIEIEEESET